MRVLIGEMPIYRLATSRRYENPRRKCFGERIVIFRTRSGLASDEVARGRLVWLARFSFAFRAKKGMTIFASSALEWCHPTKTIEQVCFSKIERGNLFSLKKQTKAYFNLESPLGKEISSDRNETLVRKINE